MPSAATDADDAHAAYLYRPEARRDLGRKCLQCVRPTDAVKLWFLWRAWGREGMAARVESLFRLRDELVAGIEAAPNLSLALPPAYLNVCFRVDPQRDVGDRDDFHRRLAIRLAEEGRAVVSEAPFRGQIVLRPAVVNPRFDPEAFLCHVQETAAAL